MKMHLAALLLTLVLPLTGCGKKSSADSGLTPAMEMSIRASTATSVTLDLRWVNASGVRLLCEATDNPAARTAREVAEQGTLSTGQTAVLDGLSPSTFYTVFAVACNDKGDFGSLQYVQFTTDSSESLIYDWEQRRNGILSFTDMALCYGGSAHRTPFRWEKERFAPFVSYVDTQGREHWMFDAFLCIEFVIDNFSLAVGVSGTSAEREQWEHLIEYWFDDDNGVNALEQAVEAAAQRLGTPPCKRKVIMVLPDPIIHKECIDVSTPTDYWGELNGRKMDFAKAEDRIAVYKWYINEVRKRFDQADYRYIELAGFYILSEELPIPGDGWNPEIKKWEEIIPPMTEYLHGLNECVAWIPYFEAAGYNRWRDFGIDYAYMQPNYYWDEEGARPLSRFFTMVKGNDLGMEFEFEATILASDPESDKYRTRFREYMAGARDNGIYGTRPLAYYQGTNAFYDLSVSENVLDRELYHEFCEFVINNPLRIE